jgi:hypothetical protein
MGKHVYYVEKRGRPLVRGFFTGAVVVVVLAVSGWVWLSVQGGDHGNAGPTTTPRPPLQYVVETGMFRTKAAATRHMEGLQRRFHFSRAGVLPCDEYRANDRRGLPAGAWLSTVGPWPHTKQGRTAALDVQQQLGHSAVLRAVRHR